VIRRPGEDEGAALITVMLVMMLLTSLVTAAVGYGLAAQPLSRRDQDAVAALAAAQAGIDDYLFRVRQSEFEQRSSTNLPPAPDNTPFLSTTWQSVPGATNGAKFHYDAKLATGALTVTSSGRVRNVTRTAQVLLRRASFLDYLYFTDFEVNSPASGVYGTDSAAAQTDCPYYWWSGNRSSSVCDRISFAPGDAINGDLHSNDTISIWGNTTFNGQVTTSMQNAICSPARRWWNTNASNGCGTPSGGLPVFSRAGDPRLPDDPEPAPDQRGPARRRRRDRLHLRRTDPAGAQFGRDDDHHQPVHHGHDHRRRQLQPLRRQQQGAAWRALHPQRQDVVAGRDQRPVHRVHRQPDRVPDPERRWRLQRGRHHQVRLCLGRHLRVRGAQRAHDRRGRERRRGGGRRDLPVVRPDDRGRPARADRRAVRPGLPPDQLPLELRRGRELGADLPGRPRRKPGRLALQHRHRGAVLGPEDPRGHPGPEPLLRRAAVQQRRPARHPDGVRGIAQKWRGTVALIGVTGYVKDYRYDPRLQYEGPPSFVDPVGKPWKVKAFAEVANPPACTATRVSLCVPP
jgi:hypothetical protein